MHPRLECRGTLSRRVHLALNDTITIEAWEAQWEIVSDSRGGDLVCNDVRRIFAILAAARDLLCPDARGLALALWPTSTGVLALDLVPAPGNWLLAVDLASSRLLVLELEGAQRASIGLQQLSAVDDLFGWLCIQGLAAKDASAQGISGWSHLLNERVSGETEEGVALEGEVSARLLPIYAWFANSLRLIDALREHAERVLSCGTDAETGICSIVYEPQRTSEIPLQLRFEFRPKCGESGEPGWLIEPIADVRPDWLAPIPGAVWRDEDRVRAFLPASSVVQGVGVRSQARMLRAFVEQTVRIFVQAASS